MSDIYKGELQDYEGNTIYPHSEADVIFCADGETAQSKMNKYEKALGNVTGVTDSLEVNDSKILASAKALYKVNSSLADGNLSFSIGEDGDPYATYKVGADTVTKKLGEPTLIGTFGGSVNTDHNSATFSLTSYKNYKNITLANMLIVIQKYGHSSNGASNESFSWTYNQSTGALSVSHSAMYNITIDVYVK